MLQHCPALFSYPATDRAAPLLEAMMGASVGLGPTQVRLGWGLDVRLAAPLQLSQTRCCCCCCWGVPNVRQATRSQRDRAASQ